MLQCYPGSIRAEFGEEMNAVFLKASLDASTNSRWGMLAVFLKELLDWPWALVDGYMDVYRLRSSTSINDDQTMSMSRDSTIERFFNMINQDVSLKMSKRHGMISALPPVLLGFGIMASALVRTDVWYRLPTWQLYLSVGVVLLSGLVVGIGGILALYKRIPTWGLSWAGCAYMGFTLFAMVFVEEGVEEGWLSIAPASELVLGLVIFFTGLSLLVLAARRGWPQAGLFTIAVACTMGLSLLQALTAAPFNRDDIAMFAGPMGLIFGSLIYMYIQRSGTVRIMIIAGVGFANSTVALIASNAWSSWLENRGAASPLLPLLVILTGLLFSGPIAGLILRSIRRLSKPAV
jgi:hypothetical protein